MHHRHNKWKNNSCQDILITVWKSIQHCEESYCLATRCFKQRTYKTYPSICIIRFSRSYSEAPGNKGNPRNSSATIHPNDHISIELVYLTEMLSMILFTQWLQAINQDDIDEEPHTICQIEFYCHLYMSWIIHRRITLTIWYHHSIRKLSSILWCKRNKEKTEMQD